MNLYFEKSHLNIYLCNKKAIMKNRQNLIVSDKLFLLFYKSLWLILLMVACHKTDPLPPTNEPIPPIEPPPAHVYLHPELVEVFFPGDQTYGTSSAVKDISYADAPWVGNGIAFLNKTTRNKFDIQLGTFHSEGYNRDHICFLNIPLKKNKNIILTNPSINLGDLIPCYTRLADDGDVIGASYNLMVGFDNYVEVTQVDTLQNIAKGTFNLGFTIKEQYKGYNLPDTVFFRNGVFDVKFY
jgi:hypothetical protein